MKIAIVSDIHGNVHGFKEFMKIIKEEKIEFILNLGDFVRGENQEWVMEAIMSDERFISIRGNHEDGYCSEILQLNECLDNKYINWIEDQEYRRIVELDGFKILMVHSRYDSNRVAPLIYSGYNLDEFLNDYPNDIDLICFGHTHIQLFIESFDGKMILNPGSLGLAVDGKINFAIIEIDKGNFSYKFYKLK